MTDQTKPAIDMTTSELATHIRRTAHANPDVADTLRPSAMTFARTITERVSNIDPADIAAVLINAACWLTDAVTVCREAGGDAQTAVNVVAIAGEQMWRNAARTVDTTGA